MHLLSRVKSQGSWLPVYSLFVRKEGLDSITFFYVVTRVVCASLIFSCNKKCFQVFHVLSERVFSLTFLVFFGYAFTYA